MTKVYVMTLDYFYDDYKRPEGNSEVIGITKNRTNAYKNIFKEEFKNNLENIDYFADEIKNEYKPDPKFKCKYKLMYEKLKDLKEITDEFINEWEDARYIALGESQYGVMPTGYVAKVSEHEVLELEYIHEDLEDLE